MINILFVISTLAVSWQNVFGQQHWPMVCICFENDTEFINANIREDSTFTSFSIVKGGFETEEQRKKVVEEYRRQVDPYQPPPSFTINFISSWKPEKIMSIKEIDNCVALVTVDEFRKDDFRSPSGTRSDLYSFIKKLPDGTFLKWIAGLMAEE